MTLSVTDKQRSLMEFCFKHRVPFFWRGPGTLLIAGGGLRQVLEEAAAAGLHVSGLEGFDIGNNAQIHPRLDLIYDASRSQGKRDALSFLGNGTPEVWFDVTLQG